MTSALGIRPAPGVTVAASGSPYNHFNCSRGCSNAPLTLADRELITGRSLAQLDEETGVSFCADCLADLPADGYEALFHVCGSPEPATIPEVVEHKTRTTQPSGYQCLPGSDIRMSDKRGRLRHDRSSWAICTCGWVSAGRDRPDARRRAREHREEQAAPITF
jgi:hypothetical protein